MGACVLLARRGLVVSVFDRESAPLAGASRWNEGKIHLGYLYGADPTMQTARRPHDAKILNGAKPATLPVEPLNKFELG
jgi:hypothetical protein